MSFLLNTNAMLTVMINTAGGAKVTACFHNTEQTHVFYILLAYENGDCPAVSVPQNGSVAQEALNLHNQAKVCHFQPIEKLACGMPQ